LVIVGGALDSDNLPVYRAILDGREGGGPLCVFPTASDEPQESMDEYVARFDSIGGAGTARGILLSTEEPERAQDQAVAEEIRTCGGFFFSGGSQSRIASVFRPEGEATPAFRAVWERHRAGAVVSGSSAGAAMMSHPMISGGGSVAALANGVSREEDEEGVEIRTGLGFLEEGLVDQHFLARGRWGRLLVAVTDPLEDRLGIGIDENTALVVEGDTARVAGASGVVLMDPRGPDRGEEGDGGRHGVRLFLVGNGDRILLSSREVLPDPSKTPLSPSRALVPEPDLDLFERWVFLRILAGFGSSSDERLTLGQDGYVVELRKEPGFQALASDGLGIQDTPSGLSLGPFVLTVLRQ
jgi:cyanophycinase